MAWVNQKFIMHAHSHFAFSGWVSHAIMVLMVMVEFRLRTTDPLPTRYQYTLAANLLTSFGMLICFILQGYGVYAIIFPTLVVIMSFVVAGYGWADITRFTLPPGRRYWFIAALLFALLPAIGISALVWLMVTLHFVPLTRFASVCIFLQY